MQPVIIDGYIDWIECPACGSRIDGVGICFSCGNTNLPDITKISPSGVGQTGVFFKGLDNEQKNTIHSTTGRWHEP